MKISYISIYLSLLILILQGINLSSTANDVWRTWTKDDGLEWSFTRQVILNGNDEVWILQTNKELSKFDGYSFKTIVKHVDEYLFVNTINSNNIIFDKFGPAGRFKGFKIFYGGVWSDFDPTPRELWGGTSFWNVYGFPLTEHEVILSSDLGLVQVNLSSNHVKVLHAMEDIDLGFMKSYYQNNTEGIWIIYEKGLCYISSNKDNSIQPVITFYRLPDNLLQKYSFTYPTSSDYWIHNIGKDLFIKVWDIEKNAFNTLRYDGVNWEEIISYQYPERAWPNLNGYLWGHDNKKLWEYYSKNSQDWVMRNIEINDVAVKNKREFFLATTQGLYYHQESLWKTPQSLSNFAYRVESIFEENDGEIIFKTNKGLSFYKDNKLQHVDIVDEDLKNIFLSDLLYLFSNSVTINNKTIYGWYNFRNNPFNYFSHDKENNTLSRVNLKEIFPVPNQEDKIYIISQIHTKYSTKPILLEHISLGNQQNHLTSIYDISNQPPALLYLLPYESEFRERSKALEHSYFYQTQDNKVWTSGKDCILSFDGNQNYSIYETPEIKTRCFIETAEGKLWAGTNKGIFQYENETWVPLDDTISGINCMIKTNDQSIWVSSSTGVSCYKNGARVTYFVEHGLPDNNINWLYQDNSGKIWCGTTKGVSYFNSGIDQEPPVVEISEKINKHQSIIHPGADVRIEFTGKDRWNYTLQEDLQYSYRINNGEWSVFSHSNVYQTSNAVAGHYRLDVRSMDMSFNISLQLSNFKFSVLFPWYKTRVFIICMTTSVLIILSLLFYSYNNHLLLKVSYQKIITSDEKLVLINQELEERVEARTSELLKSERRALLLKEIAVAANAASNSDEVLQVALDCVCQFTNWPVGHVYIPAEDGAQYLVPTQLWHFNDPNRFANFKKITEQTKFAPGIGLPGRVLTSGKSAWLVDVTKDLNFPRYKLSEDIAVYGAFAFPVQVGQELLAVLEFFSDKAEEPDETILGIMDQIGAQLWIVIKRKQVEEDIRKLNEELEQRVYERTEELQKLSRAVEDSPVSVVITDSEGNIEYVNPKSQVYRNIWIQ